ncbi:hypothetical protein F2P81_013794 [Scophthalmus maximus]|uniref:Uncharacterized protein n=1 Tax=Scophthalmus maximus TaxID=52904 RepID=A0A6A4SNJ0_SCOMX|nr:hypothetical protein F2P81_013794 [Scophthalmus maximus]
MAKRSTRYALYREAGKEAPVVIHFPIVASATLEVSEAPRGLRDWSGANSTSVNREDFLLFSDLIFGSTLRENSWLTKVLPVSPLDSVHIYMKRHSGKSCLFSTGTKSTDFVEKQI